MALSINRKAIVRPNVLLCLMTVLVLGTILTSLQPEHFGTIFRTARFTGFVATLWLLTPWWGGRDVLLLRCHLATLGVCLGSVVIGLLIAPGRARPSGRLSGVIWPMPPTQVAHYAAVVTGVAVVLWFCGHMRGRTTLMLSIGSLAILLLSHTRTALAALIAGILIAGLNLIVAKARVREALRHRGADRRGHGHDVLGRHRHLAGARPELAGPEQSHRPYRGLGSAPNRPA